LRILIIDLLFIHHTFFFTVFYDGLPGKHRHVLRQLITNIRTLVPKIPEVLLGQARLVEVHGLTSSQEQDLIELLESLFVGVRVGADDGALLFDSQLVKQFDDAARHLVAQVACGIIKENKFPVADKLCSERCALALTGGEPLDWEVLASEEG